MLDYHILDYFPSLIWHLTCVSHKLIICLIYIQISKFSNVIRVFFFFLFRDDQSHIKGLYMALGMMLSRLCISESSVIYHPDAGAIKLRRSVVSFLEISHTLCMAKYGIMKSYVQ